MLTHLGACGVWKALYSDSLVLIFCNGGHLEWQGRDSAMTACSEPPTLQPVKASQAQVRAHGVLHLPHLFRHQRNTDTPRLHGMAGEHIMTRPSGSGSHHYDNRYASVPPPSLCQSTM